MTDPRQHHDEPTRPTLDFLRDLAMQTGQSFAWPRTQREASEEIERLKRARRTSRADRRRETLEVRRDAAERSGDEAAVRGHELTGWGSTAQWADDSGEGDDGRGTAR